MRTYLVQLSDLHICAPGELAYRQVDTAAALQAAVRSVIELAQAPHGIVLTGDLVDHGRPAEYAHLRELIAPLAGPVYLMPGNHDDADALRAAFPEHTYLPAEGDVNYVVRIGALQLIALDSTVPGHTHGELDAHRLRWLEQALEATQGQPVVIAMHHPPFRTLIRFMDEYGLRSGAAELEAIVRGYPNVERIVCGHLHRPIDVRFGGTFASACPSPAHQLALDLAHQDGMAGWTLEPPAFKLHAWDPSAGLVTHQANVGEFKATPFWS